MAVIITDLDDTIIQCSDILQRFLLSTFGLYSEDRLKDHHNIPKLYGINLERTLEMVADFHRSHWMDKMPPEPCAAVVLPELHRAGYQFVAVTACLDEPKVVQARLRNLQEVFGFEWLALHCVGLTSSKEVALKLYPPSIWVDDLAHHAATGAELGHRAFLINKPYNQGDIHSEVTRVTDWHELMRLL